MVAACWLVWLFWGKRRQRFASIVAASSLACFSGYVLAAAPIPDTNLFNAIYCRVLRNSMYPQASLTELGLKPEIVSWMGKMYWEVNIDSPDLFPGKASTLRLAKFYLRHPLLDLRMTQTGLSFSNDVPYLGNYTSDSGAPCMARARAFVQYDILRSKLARVPFLFAFLAANLIASSSGRVG